MTSEKRRSLWESTLQITFRPEQVIGRRTEELTNHYEIGEYIQSGAFGSVWFCKHKESGAQRAVKYVKKSDDKKENELILREFVSSSVICCTGSLFGNSHYLCFAVTEHPSIAGSPQHLENVRAF